MRFRILSLLVVAILVGSWAVSLSAQTKPPVKPAGKVQAKTANRELIALAKDGTSEVILMGVVAQTDKSKYDKSAAGIRELKSAGISERVIAAILGVNLVDSSSADMPQAHPASKATAPASSSKPSGVHLAQTPTQSVEGREAGIYVAFSDGKMVQLEPAIYSSGKTGNKFLSSMTGLAKGSIKAVVRSARAGQRLENSTPTFYFYFENKGAGLSNTGGLSGFQNGASSPNEFVLVRMSRSKDEREFVVAESWAFSDRVGVRSKDTVDFSIQKLQPGVYKVTPKEALVAGEYCFFYAHAALIGESGKLFDFGVDSAVSAENR